ncbi:Fic family protein [uncultured Thiodictyon sp.]|uniref:Fic family protein n=1 Tax=uncultured Thiodictyon sp. TaxID=1846217 RepID=UPI0025CD86E1|nr:Fic family protein [uncultured Thiodictyon sp.]
MNKFQSGRLVDQRTYRSFSPTPLDRPWQIDDMGLIQLLGEAERELGRLDMFSDYVPNVDLYIRMHVIKEATQSSRIEGTRTNIAEALQEREEIALDRRDDWEEVQNYVTAMNEAVARLPELPLSSRLIRDTHRTLLQGVRGRHKQPGEFRLSQNWIGGATIDDAVFVPPLHTEIPDLIADIERFVHNEAYRLPDLVKIALVHYQFETIHPFLDGNGRVGRLLITLYLVSKGILKRPVLYLSDFFERNRVLYYDNLMRVRERNDLMQWLKFFLVGVIETARGGVATFDAILRLQRETDTQIATLGSRATKARKVIDYLYGQPLADAARLGAAAELSPASTYKLVADLERLGILKETTGGKRGKTYAFAQYLGLFQS